jgi:hypothetical protein
MSESELSLKVLEAYTRDVGRGVARIDYDSMDTLNASTGDVIEIKGKRRTVAKCLPLYPSDEGKGIIRIDGLGRNNSGIAIGDTIKVKKVKAAAAEKSLPSSLIKVHAASMAGISASECFRVWCKGFADARVARFTTRAACWNTAQKHYLVSP